MTCIRSKLPILEDCANSTPPRSDLQRELEDAELQLQDTKEAYYAALTARNRALRALAHQLATTNSTEPPEFPVYYDAQGNEHAES